MKKVLYALITIIGFGNATMAQVPSYVPTNSLVAWYPFNGNANDLSGNGNNLVINGPTLIKDRFNNCNNAFHFSAGQNLFKSTPNTNGINFTWSLWMKKINADSRSHAIQESTNNSTTGGGFTCEDNLPQFICQGIAVNVTNSNTSIALNSWTHFVITKSGSTFSIYINGVLSSSGSSSYNAYNASTWFKLGGGINTAESLMDDVAMWNRVLTQNEITNLYNGTAPHTSNTIITNQPLNQFVGLNDTATFNLTTTNPLTHQWQSNSNQLGWQNIPSNNYYTGVNTNTLKVTNVSVSNHNQAFRALVNSNGCADTSKVVYLKVADTCLTKVTDTIFTTVTDTLIIQTKVGLPTPNIANTLLIYPNPAKDRITIDNGNFTVMSGYSIKIQNSLGQQVFNSAITQAQFSIDLSTWTGKGIYYVRLLDASGNVVTTRKILLQ